MITVECEPIHRTRRIDQGVQRVEHNRLYRRNQEKHDKPFIGWDGEGYNLDGSHYYSLFGNSLGARIEKPSLDWRDCIRLLLEAPRDAIHVIYAGTYDVVMMFRDSPVVTRLLSGQPTKVLHYQITYRKGKYLTVTDLERKGSTRTLYDVFTFFRTSFVKACQEYGVGDESMLAAVEDMKGQRNDFSTITPEIRTYMGRELDLLVQLCDNLRDRLALANIYPAQWHGPGAIASAVLRTHKIASAKGTYTEIFRECSESAYYGGRFEQFQRGTYIGKVYQYDIRSAYPAAMTHLPDLSQVHWEHYETNLPKEHSDYALYRLTQRSVKDGEIGTLPNRNRFGTISFPSWVHGWYWGIECRHIPHKYRKECYYPTGPGLQLRPFSFVQEAYTQRAILKAANQPQQLALKLMLNSLYGKLAQSKGARRDHKTGEWVYPTFHETVWAGWITAYTRAKLSEAMHTAEPRSIIACETDSVFSTVPLPLKIGEGLGEWELTESDGIRYIQSGVSLLLQDGEWKFKTRGFTVKRTVDEVKVWTDFLESPNPIMHIRQTRFNTDPRTDGFGTWYTMERNLSLTMSPLEKRIHAECRQCAEGHSLGESLHPMIVLPMPQTESVPYKFAWRGERETSLMDILFDFENDPVLVTEYF